MKSGSSYCREQGVALLLVLWIVTLLAVICAEFSTTMRMEATVARNFRESEQAYYAAEAGINRAILELMRSSRQKKQGPGATEDITDTEALDGEERADLEYWKPGETYEFTIDDMLCGVEIEDESNKVNINEFLGQAKRNPTPLKELLRNKVGLEGEDIDIVADSLIDWYDADNNITGVNGAEDDYYEKLDPPHKCRNGDIPVIEELLLVRGIDEELLYGKRGRSEQKIELSSEDLDDILSGVALQEDDLDEDLPAEDDEEAGMRFLGLIDIFCAPPPDFGGGAKVNPKGDITLDINTATADQLLLLDGMTPGTAAEIVEERKKRPFASKEDRLPGFKNFFRWRESITVSPPGGRNQETVRITARGCAPDGIVCRSITCTMMFARNAYFVMSWKEIN